MRGVSVAALVALLLVSSAAVARADLSPGVSPSRIKVDDPVGQGEDIRLPSLSISNRGDERGTFSADTSFIGDQQERIADASWFEFKPERIELEPGAGAVVAVRMRIPRDAEPGDYRTLLRIRAQPAASEGGGAVISAAVAATLLFTVENRDFHFYDPVTDFFTDRAPFSYVGVGMLLALFLAYLIRRRLRFRVSFGVERRE